MQLTFIIFLSLVFFLAVLISYHKNSKSFLGIALIIAFIIGALSTFDGIDLKVGSNSTLLEDNRSIVHEDVYEPIDVRYSRGFGLTFIVIMFYIGWLLSEPGKDEEF